MAQGNAKGTTSSTNLSYTASPTDGTVNSDTGNNATLPLADATNAGLLSPSDFTKLGNQSGTNTGDQDLSGLVPYTGATTDVDLDTHNLNANAFHVKGTGGSGHIGLKHQSSDVTASASETALYADANGDIKYKNDGNYLTTLKTSTNTANRVYTFQDRNGTIADDTDLALKADLESPALTGNPTAPTQSANDNSTKIATTAYVDSAVTASSGFLPKLDGTEVFRGVTYRNGSTTEDTWGGVTMTNDASSSAKTIANTTYLTSKIRKGFYHTVVSSGHMMDMRYNGYLFYIGAGFRFVCSFGIPDTVYGSGCRQFHGLRGSSSAPTYSDTVQVDSMTDIIGIGSESSDTNLQIFYNDASGTASKVDLGANFPANRDSGSELTTMYSVTLYNAIGTSTVLYEVVNGETGDVAQGTISTDLPATTQSLTFVASRCMGGGGGNNNTGRLDIGKLGVYSIYQ